MALPGGDPIAAALAAGETPSPEMVAASREKEGFTPRAAIACFAGVLLSIVLVALTRPYSDFTSHARLDIPPDGLAFRAQEILKQLGYSEPSNHTAYGFDLPDRSFLTQVENYDTARRDALLASHQPAVLRFWYRQYRDDFWPDSFSLDRSIFCCTIQYDSPPNLAPGMIRLGLDPKGRLIGLEARPPIRSDPDGAAKPSDWPLLFAAAGLDYARFVPSPPQEVPPMAIDSRAAWTGTFASAFGELSGDLHADHCSQLGGAPNGLGSRNLKAGRPAS
jgi:serine/threonine-protein kinase